MSIINIFKNDKELFNTYPKKYYWDLRNIFSDYWDDFLDFAKVKNLIIRNVVKRDVERIFWQKIESEPDLKYYIDNDYITKLINLLIEGIGDVVEENNKKLVRDLFR